MNSSRIKSVRTTITAADRLQFWAHVAEAGKTAADAFAKLSEPIQAMIVASATEFGRIRTISTRPMPTPTNLRMIRLNKGWSLDQAAAELNKNYSGARWTGDLLNRVEENKPPRAQLKHEMVRDLETTFQEGYELLTSRYIQPSE